jgi:predicted alpha/beta-hydrolase family hydrolase
MRGTRLLTLCVALAAGAGAAAEASTRLVRVGEGWARTQVNAVIFRRT